MSPSVDLQRYSKDSNWKGSSATITARVRSPGGTTAAAFDYLDSTDFRAIFSAAVVAARDRAVDLADQAHEAGKD